MLKKKKNKVIEDKKDLDEDFLNSLSEEELEAIAAEIDSEDDKSEDEDEVVEEETVEESSEKDADTTSGMDKNYKTNMLSVAMHKLAGKTPDQVAFFLASLDQVGHEADGVPGGAAAHNKSSVAMKGDAKSAKLMETLKNTLKEDLSNVFGDNKELSEEFKNNMTVLFESAVNFRVTAIEQQLVESYEEAFKEEVEELTTKLHEDINEYLTYTAKEWIKENEVAIERALKTEITEDFLDGLRDLFITHNFNMPDEVVEIAEALEAKVDDLEAQLSETIEKNKALSEELNSSHREALLQDQAEGLTVPEQEKFEKLAESVDYYGDDEEFVHKLNIIKESHFGKKKGTPKTNIITEEITYSSDDKTDTKEKYIDPDVRPWVNALKKTVRQQ
jgi:hypothetical protein